MRDVSQLGFVALVVVGGEQLVDETVEGCAGLELAAREETRACLYRIAVVESRDLLVDFRIGGAGYREVPALLVERDGLGKVEERLEVIVDLGADGASRVLALVRGHVSGHDDGSLDLCDRLAGSLDDPM